MISAPLIAWGERFLFAPNPLQKTLSLLLLPLSLLYCLVVFAKFLMSFLGRFNSEIPIVSIGNLVIGGSGKTPITIALAKKYARSAIILRGYGRASQGTMIVSLWGEIVADVKQSGDEAMLYARSLPESLVIVAADRIEGINLAKANGAQVIWLDDAYSKHFIDKLDLLLEPSQKRYLPWCIPAGPYREKRWWGKKALVLEEERDFWREVNVNGATSQMVLITGISKPWRLDPFLPDGVIKKVYFPDHYPFEKSELASIAEDSGATSILVTEKDAVKMEGYGLKLSILELTMKVDGTITKKIDDYIKESRCRKK